MLQSLFNISTTISTSRSIDTTFTNNNTNTTNNTNVTLYISIISLCTILSLLFVGIFYIFVPKYIRYQYDRNHVIHIQWRIYVSIVYVSIVIVFIKYCVPILLLKVVSTSTQSTISTESFNVLLLLNTNMYSNIIAIMKVLCHTSILYLGSLVQSYITLYNVTMITIQSQQNQQSPQQVSDKSNNNSNTKNKSRIQNILQFVFTFIELWYNVHVRPIIEAILEIGCFIQNSCNNSNQQQTNDDNDSNTNTWILIRNIIIAPIIEECIFRYCIISLLLVLFIQQVLVPIQDSNTQVLNNSSYDTTTTKLSVYDSLSCQQLVFICWIGPLFFGIAHINHAITQLYQLYSDYNKSNGSSTTSNSKYYSNSIRRIILSSLFQIVYTTIFGSFVTYVYICTNGSLVSIIICHSYCNYLGLPNIQCFIQLVSSSCNQSRTTTDDLHNPLIVPFFISVLYIVGIILFYYGFNYW